MTGLGCKMTGLYEDWVVRGLGCTRTAFYNDRGGVTGDLTQTIILITLITQVTLTSLSILNLGFEL